MLCSILTVLSFYLTQPEWNVDRKPAFIGKILFTSMFLKTFYLTTSANTVSATTNHFLSHFSILLFLSTYYYLKQYDLAIIQLKNLRTMYLFVLFYSCTLHVENNIWHTVDSQIFLSEKNEHVNDYFTSASKASNTYITS